MQSRGLQIEKGSVASGMDTERLKDGAGGGPLKCGVCAPNALLLRVFQVVELGGGRLFRIVTRHDEADQGVLVQFDRVAGDLLPQLTVGGAERGELLAPTLDFAVPLSNTRETKLMPPPQPLAPLQQPSTYDWGAPPC